MTAPPVLVTGGSGFLALHTIAALLARGHRVRAVVGTPVRALLVREVLDRHGVAVEGRLTLVLEEDGWAAAVAGCEHVLHMAGPADAPAVLDAASDAGVQRVVVTAPEVPDWAGELELCTISPVALLGPVLGPDRPEPVRWIEALLDGSLDGGVPRVSLAVADVRDVAGLHLAAMIAPQAAGERFVAAAGEGMWLTDVVRVLRERLADPIAAKLPSIERPGPPAELSGVPDAKARELLGWRPRAPEITILETALSLLPEPGTPAADTSLTG